VTVWPPRGTANYVQDFEPPAPNEGEVWFDTSSGVFYVYADAGDGIRWNAVAPPVQVTEDASTFDESDVILTETDTKSSSGTIELLDDRAGTKVDEYANVDGTVLAGPEKVGIIVNPNTDLAGVNATLGPNTDPANDDYPATTAYLERRSDGTILDTHDISGYTGGTTFRLSGNLAAGTRYNVFIDAEGDSYRASWDSDGVLPSTSADIDVPEAVNRDGNLTSEMFAIGAVEAILPGKATGDTLTGWESGTPVDIRSWDLVTYQAVEDGETVRVDVEDGNGNVLFEDIPQNFDVSTVDAATDVHLRTHLSRQDTANNPRVEYLARRFTR